MPLPLLSTTSADLLRHFLRCDLHRARHLIQDETPLDSATALTNPTLPTVPDANHARDAALPPGLSPQYALSQINAHFAQYNTRCAYYVLNPSVPQSQTAPLRDHLLASGFYPDPFDILRLARTPTASPHPQPPGLKIIPARASYRHARQLAEEFPVDRAPDPAAADARMLHLDDPHHDALLILDTGRGRALATAAILAVGDLGLISDLYVTPSHRRQGLAKLLLSRLLEIAARSLFNHVLLDVAPANTPAQNLYAQSGFQKVATHTPYRAPWTRTAAEKIEDGR